jgi:hypothetical protein
MAATATPPKCADPDIVLSPYNLKIDNYYNVSQILMLCYLSMCQEKRLVICAEFS